MFGGISGVMLFDAPIFDEGTRQIVFKDPNTFDIAIRYERTVAFREYLTKVWNGAGFKVAYYDWNGFLAGGAEGFESVARFIERTRR